MRRNLLVAVLVGTGLTFSMWCTALAQNQGQPQRTGGTGAVGAGTAASAAMSPADARVALVDIAHVFKNYDKFNKLHEQLKADVKARENEITQMQNELKQLLNARTQQNPESQTYKDYDAKIAQRKAELELLNDSSRREFTQREANIYHTTYQDVEAQIKRYATANGIILVLRAARDEDARSTQPQDVIKEMSQQVIYAVPGLDITDTIIKMLNGTSANKPAGPTTPGKSSPVPATGKNDKNVPPANPTKPGGGTKK